MDNLWITFNKAHQLKTFEKCVGGGYLTPTIATTYDKRRYTNDTTDCAAFDGRYGDPNVLAHCRGCFPVAMSYERS